MGLEGRGGEGEGREGTNFDRLGKSTETHKSIHQHSLINIGVQVSNE